MLAEAAWALKTLPFAACSYGDTELEESRLNPSKTFDERNFTPLGLSTCGFTAVTLEYIVIYLPSTNKDLSYRLADEAIMRAKNAPLLIRHRSLRFMSAQEIIVETGSGSCKPFRCVGEARGNEESVYY